jgi:hypothetical protein
VHHEPEVIVEVLVRVCHPLSCVEFWKHPLPLLLHLLLEPVVVTVDQLVVVATRVHGVAEIPGA